MKKRLLSIVLILAMLISLLPAAPLKVHAASAPTAMWVAPSAENGIPAKINLFKKKTGGTNNNPTYTYQLYLPGGTDLDACFLSWDGDATIVVDGTSYSSGECPVPPCNTEKSYKFMNGSQTLATYTLITYQGSPNVQRVFIEIDESKGTIAAMDGDINHETTCSGLIYVNGTEYVLDKMKGRGNATWTGAEDKKPYNITFGSKINFPGVTSEKTKKWSFLAEITDHSLLSNRSGYHLAYELGIGQDTTSADVWMNGEYQGCYTVTPKTDSFVTKDGYMIEQDNYKEPSVENGGDPQFLLDGLKEASGWSSCYNRITVKKIGDNLLLKDGVVDESPENLTAVAGEIQSWLQDAWDAIRSDTGYNSKGKYYTDYIDMVSFAKMYLLHEYAKSYDVCAGSILFHRDGTTDDCKLIAGPAWDLDNAMGSTCQNSSLGKADDRRNGDRRSGQGSFIANVTEYKTSIYKTISKHADFMEEVNRQYNRYRSAFDNLPNVVEQLKNEIADSAKMNHYKVNDITGTFKNVHKYSSATTLGSGQYSQSYLATTNSQTDWVNYVANLKTYVTARTLWFHNTYYDATYCDHTYDTVVTPPTCTAQGYTTYTCTKCGDTYVDDYTPMIPHEYHDGVCSVCGALAYVASFSCGEGASVTVYETQNITGACQANASFAYPRDSKTGAVDCSGEGQINFVVNLEPGYTLSGVTVEPTSAYKNLKKPADTGITNGYRITKVTGDLTVTVTTVVCDHHYETTVTPPSCTAEGFTTHSCTLCGYSYTSNPVPKIAHDYQNGHCSMCGEALITVSIECDEGASVTVYETQSLDSAHVDNASTAHPRDGSTGLIDCSGEGQINLVVDLAPGYELDSITAAPKAYKNMKGPDDTGITNGYRFTKVTGDFTITVTTKKTQAAPVFKSHQLLLGNQIGMYFYMTIPEDYVSGSSMVFDVGGDQTTVTTTDSLKQSDGRYRFLCNINAVQMADTITATFRYSDNGTDKTVIDTTTVENYLDVLITNENNNSEYAKAKETAKALNDYGYYSQLAADPQCEHTRMQKAYKPVSELISTLDGYAVSATLGSGIKSASYGLSLTSETKINLYFATDGLELSAANTSVTVNDNTTFAYTVEKDGDRYRVRITGINAAELGSVFTIAITGGTTVTASALSYVQTVLTTSQTATDEVKHAAAAMYSYFDETVKYIN